MERVRVIGTREVSAILLFTLGGVVLPVIGPLAGIILILLSPRWNAFDKLVAAVTWPVVVGAVIYGLDNGSVETCLSSEGGRSTCETTGSEIATLFMVGGLLLPLLVAGYLLVRARRNGRPAALPMVTSNGAGSEPEPA